MPPWSGSLSSPDPCLDYYNISISASIFALNHNSQNDTLKMLSQIMLVLSLKLSFGSVFHSERKKSDILTMADKALPTHL